MELGAAGMPQLVCERPREGQSLWVLTGTSLKSNLLKFWGGDTHQHYVHHTFCMSTCPVHPRLAGCKGGKASFCWCFCFNNWIIHPGLKTLIALGRPSPPPVFLLSAPSVWLNSILFHVHSFLLPILSPHYVSFSHPHTHIFLYPTPVFQLPLSDLSLNQFSSVSALFLLSVSIFDFHQTASHLSHSDFLSFYFFWWQSLISLLHLSTSPLCPDLPWLPRLVPFFK